MLQLLVKSFPSTIIRKSYCYLKIEESSIFSRSEYNIQALKNQVTFKSYTISIIFHEQNPKNKTQKHQYAYTRQKQIRVFDIASHNKTLHYQNQAAAEADS